MDRVVPLTLLALVAFAANSLLCREALGTHAIDASMFTVVRLLAGAVVLAPLAWRGHRQQVRPRWSLSLALFAYAICFSLAYVSLDAGTGALLLFGAVQVIMIGGGLVGGERPRPIAWIGIVVALAGLGWLVLPRVSTPSWLGAVLMLGAGVAWGLYSLAGRGASAPSLTTAWAFVGAAPIACVAGGIALASGPVVATPHGVVLAVISGAVTSALGYLVWYQALRGHTATTAACVQLAVPVLAAAGGVLFLGENVSARLVQGGALVIGGVATVILARSRH